MLDAAEIGRGTILVEGMGGDAELGHAVHVFGADLKLRTLEARTDDGGVDRLVVIVLGDRNIVLEAAGYDLPLGVDDADSAVAFLDRPDDDAEADHVGELFQRDRLALDLVEDRKG